jgi:MFS family permease
MDRVTDKTFRYFITLATIQPLYGKISDVFGRKPALLSAYLVLALGCLLCGLAKNLGEIIAARALAGMCDDSGPSEWFY